MSIGCPVISTRIGAEGLAVVDRDNILFAERPDEFVARIEDLKTSAELSNRLAGNARALVLRQYDWQSCLKALDGLYGELLGAEPRPWSPGVLRRAGSILAEHGRIAPGTFWRQPQHLPSGST